MIVNSGLLSPEFFVEDRERSLASKNLLFKLNIGLLPTQFNKSNAHFDGWCYAQDIAETP